MPTYLTFLLVLTMLFSFHTPASVLGADKNSPLAERPTPTKGDTWYYIYNGDPFVVTYRGTEGNNHVFDAVHKNIYQLVKYQTFDLCDVKLLFSTGEAVWEFDPRAGTFKFPLTVGDSWTHNFSYSYRGGASISRTVFAKVMAYEEVTVPAGKFWAYRIEAKNQRRDRPAAAYETYWYAPGVKAIIKAGSTELQYSMELQSFSLTTP